MFSSHLPFGVGEGCDPTIGVCPEGVTPGFGETPGGWGVGVLDPTVGGSPGVGESMHSSFLQQGLRGSLTSRHSGREFM